MQLVPDLPDVDTRKASAIAARLRAYAFTLNIWEQKRDHAIAMIAEFEKSREAFIAHLPDLPVWISERGTIGCDCPDDAA